MNRSKKVRGNSTAGRFGRLMLPIGLLAWSVSCVGATREPENVPLVPDADGWVVSVGQQIPPLEFVDEDGQPRSLDEFLGRPVVLLFWGTT